MKPTLFLAMGGVSLIEQRVCIPLVDRHHRTARHTHVGNFAEGLPFRLWALPWALAT